MSLFAALDRHRDRVALIGADGGALSYAALLTAADRIGRHARRDVGRVLAVVVCRNDVDCVAGYVGLMRAGAAVMLLHHSTKSEQFDAILGRFGPNLVFAPAGYCVAGRPLDRQGGYVLSDTGAPPPALHPDLALLLTTSGTTGSRNFVRLGHGNILANARAIAEVLDIGADERPITTMPLSYSYGLSILHSHLLQGASVVMCEDGLVSPGFWALMREQAVTSLGGVPFVYDMLKKLRLGRMDLPALKTLTQAGGRMAPELVQEFAEMCAASGRRLIVMYGQTEATARIACLPWDEARRRPGSIGRPLPGGRLWIEDDDGNVIDEAGAVGELIHGGANVCLGYAAAAADLARGDDNGGVLRTGDLAMRDEDGFFHIVGRRKRFLKLFGNRVNLDELEEMLAAEGVQCACAGSDDALIVYAAGGDADAVKAVLSTRTGLTSAMVRVVLVPAIPRQESGKVDYGALGGGHG